MVESSKSVEKSTNVVLSAYVSVASIRVTFLVLLSYTFVSAGFS